MQAIRRGLAPEREASILQVFLQASGYPVNPDGRFGGSTDMALRAFQLDHGLIVDGTAGEKTWTKLFSLHPDLLTRLSAKWLSQQDIDDFAARRSLEVPAVRAVYGVESGGVGFIGLRPKILFEGHVFWRQMQEAGLDPAHFVEGNADILFVSWRPGSYAGGLAEHDRLERAGKIHRVSALRSASWGLFQVLGYNAETLGFADVEAFVSAMSRSEADQLDTFGRFIAGSRYRGKSLLDWLRAKNWTAFAAGYNGPGYARNRYDRKLAAAYAKYAAARG
jgi:N-acetylmuramidase/Putative peptidoglycan binding domain